MEFETIILEKADRIAILTMNRPDRLNAINGQLMHDLAAAMTEVSEDQEIRVLILTGAGRAFSAGGDISEPASVTYGETIREKRQSLYQQAYHDVTLRLYNMEIPTVAMVNGMALGWGFDLVLACDVRIASEKAKFQVAFTSAGITPATGTIWLLPRAVGPAKAAELTFTADFLETAEAERMGVLNRVVTPDRLKDETMSIARKIADGPPLALRLAKWQLHKGMNTSLDEALQTAALCQATCLESEDHKEAIAAFREKRKPVFKGI